MQTVTLIHGLAEGKYKEAEIRPLTARDLFDASAEAERCVQVPIGHDANGRVVHEAQLVTSPSAMALHSLRRQVSILPNWPAPLEPEIFSKLDIEDLELLQKTADRLERVQSEVAQRGRSDRDGNGTEADAQ